MDRSQLKRGRVRGQRIGDPQGGQWAVATVSALPGRLIK